MNNVERAYKTQTDLISPDFSLSWGCREDGQVKFQKLVELTSDHLRNILVTQKQIDNITARTIVEILRVRDQASEFDPSEFNILALSCKVEIAPCSRYGAKALLVTPDGEQYEFIPPSKS